MRFSVLINNHNYARFLGRAVASVQRQTRACDQIVIVDDGSSDDSLRVARDLAAGDQRVRVVAQAHGGQLSAVNAGLAAVTGDVICFLDADDEYREGWLERLAGEYQRCPEVDFIYCRCELSAAAAAVPLWTVPDTDHDFGITCYRAMVGLEEIGGPMSTISMRSALARRILPWERQPPWPVGADQVLAFATSLAGARKLFLTDSLVRYHVHGHNLWFGVVNTSAAKLQAEIRRRQLVAHLAGPLPVASAFWRDLPRMLLREFRTLPRPRPQDARCYLRLMARSRGGRWRWNQVRLLLAWWRSRRTRTRTR